MTEHYTLGEGKAPSWCKNFISSYRKADGSMGYEYHGKTKDYSLKAGDKLVRSNRRIYVRRKRVDESKRISSTSSKT